MSAVVASAPAVTNPFASKVIFVLVAPVIAVFGATLALNISNSALLNNPAVVPDTDADGIFNVIAGVVVALATVEVKVLPVVVNVIGFTFVTVPPVPVAVKVPFVKLNPVPMETSPATAADVEFMLPTNLLAPTFCIFA